MDPAERPTNPGVTKKDQKAELKKNQTRRRHVEKPYGVGSGSGFALRAREADSRAGKRFLICVMEMEDVDRRL